MLLDLLHPVLGERPPPALGASSQPNSKPQQLQISKDPNHDRPMYGRAPGSPKEAGGISKHAGFSSLRNRRYGQQLCCPSTREALYRRTNKRSRPPPWKLPAGTD
jgi:hypothetical protein